jgi:hypothetical protein
LIDRKFRLADETGSLGLKCTMAGLSLAGAPLLRTTAAGFEPRPADELSGLLKSAYGDDVVPAELFGGFEVIARALNQGDLGRAMVAALRLRLPELDWRGAMRVARAHDALAKGFDPGELRDRFGRWTTGGSANTGHAATSKPPRAPSRPDVGSHVWNAALVQSALQSLHPKLEAKFDTLGPIQFSKEVANFGRWLGQQAHDGRKFDLVNARAEYAFLQDRLTFWLGYKDAPPRRPWRSRRRGADPLYGSGEFGRRRRGEALLARVDERRRGRQHGFRRAECQVGHAPLRQQPDRGGL